MGGRGGKKVRVVCICSLWLDIMEEKGKSGDKKYIVFLLDMMMSM